MVSILILLRKMKSSNVWLSPSPPNPRARFLVLASIAKAFGPELFWNIIQIPSFISYGVCDTLSGYVLLFFKVSRQQQLTLGGSDIFWTFTSGSLWNTTFKLLFLSSSLYTVYLMLNDYKPTHDPNIDTFKVEYLLGASFVLGVLFPHKYTIAEVSIPFICTYVPTEETILITRPNLRRSYGPFRYGSNLSPYYRNSSCYSELAKPKLSQPITYSRWGLTGPCISPIGCFAILLKALLSPSPASRARYRQFFIPTFSGFTIPSTSNFFQPPGCAFSRVIRNWR